MYTEKLKNIMSEISLFSVIFPKSPAAGGITFNTDIFKDNISFDNFALIFETQSTKAYEQYKQLIPKAYEFEDALKEFVNSDNFVNSWNEMSKQEKEFLIYFDSHSYACLRNKISKEDIIEFDWAEILNGLRPEWSKNFSTILGLSEEFATPPENKLQALKQCKALLQEGYSDEEVKDFSNAMNVGVNHMAQKLVKLVCQKKNSDEVEKIVDSLGGNFPYWHRYTMNFIEEEENKLKNKKFKP